jgi:predicted dehydrogenase
MMRGALIGCGYISKQQLAAWKQIADADIVTVCDLDENKAQRRAAEFGVSAVYTRCQKMLDEQQLDFVDIAMRSMNHLELVRICTERDPHVLCQKPVAEAREMVVICDRAVVLFMVNENLRHQAWFRKIKLLIDDGLLGDLHYARLETRWRSTLPVQDFEGQYYF